MTRGKDSGSGRVDEGADSEDGLKEVMNRYCGRPPTNPNNTVILQAGGPLCTMASE